MHNKDTVGKVETYYKTDETGARIANIPYSEYIKDCSLDGTYVTADVREYNSGEANSAAVNKAVESLGTEGGTVYIPAGEYKVTTIELKSNITLFISPDAKLISLTCDENVQSDTPIRDGSSLPAMQRMLPLRAAEQ